MKTRPRELTGLTLIMLGIAASFPIQIIWLFGDSPLDWGAILNKLTPLNWAVIGTALALSPIAFRASPLFWIVAPAFLGAVVWNNWLVAAVQGDPWISPIHLSTAGMILTFIGVLISPASRRALTQPKARWWLTPHRRQVRLDARLCPTLGGEVMTTTFDISEKGIFIALDEANWRGSRFRTPQIMQKALTVGSYCSLRVVFNEMSAFTCTAEIVRRADAIGSYPGGIGLRFVALTSEEKRTLTTFLRALDSRAPLDAIIPKQLAA